MNTAMAASRHSYKARCHSSWAAVALEWSAIAQGNCPTPFQTPVFLEAWYATLGRREGCRPVLVEVTSELGLPVMLLPLILSQEGNLSVAAFADGGVTDNNAPILGPDAPRDAADWQKVWRAVRRALPRCDVLQLRKMPATLNGQPNPLLEFGPTNPSPLSAHPITMGDSFEDYSRSRATKFRKEQERIWRVFQRHDGARFDLVGDRGTRARILTDMERLQSARMQEIGADYLLDDANYAALYRHLLLKDQTESAVLGALTAGDEMVGALLGVTDGHVVTFVRIAHAGGIWSTCSPGRLVIERMMMALHERGVRRFDFSVGDYQYKENFGIGSVPLFDLSVPLSWRGVPAATASSLWGILRRAPALRAVRDRFRKKPPQSLARST